MEYYFFYFVHDFMLRAEINFVSNWMDDVGQLRTILNNFEGEEYCLHILLITNILLTCVETVSTKLQLHVPMQFPHIKKEAASLSTNIWFISLIFSSFVSCSFRGIRSGNW